MRSATRSDWTMNTAGRTRRRDKKNSCENRQYQILAHRLSDVRQPAPRQADHLSLSGRSRVRHQAERVRGATTTARTGEYCDKGPSPSARTNACRRRQTTKTCDLVGGGHQCKGGQCKFGRCYTPNSVAMGGTCYVDDACKEGKCSSLDGAKGSCVCKSDADCGAGRWCKAGTGHQNQRLPGQTRQGRTLR